ncbi:hypothetical protein N7G274_005769 [Stereocaulon virgatum]|uniref:Uncharacterized protein n=1 Tax=Stereocaulon virgatum TaxID=373712 RepID=A0ABR4AAA0_9LECA
MSPKHIIFEDYCMQHSASKELIAFYLVELELAKTDEERQGVTGNAERFNTISIGEHKHVVEKKSPATQHGPSFTPAGAIMYHHCHQCRLLAWRTYRRPIAGRRRHR